jgi:endonuclease/exonuclease/phosphatase family metal-dependent hydrolase
VLVRSWNLFHGNTKPPQPAAFLEEMLHLATADGPDVLCLQEVPVWALPHLEGWSGMQAVGDVAARPMLGPLPGTAALGKALTDLDHGLFRSAFSGQANAILVRKDLHLLARRVETLNPRRLRAAQARLLGLDWIARLAWGKERRIVQAVHVAADSERPGRTAWIGNLHATSYPPDQRLPDAEVLRAATFVDGLAAPGELVVLAGDFNVSFLRSRTLHELTAPEWGFSNAGPAIDHVLVRGAQSTPVHRWPDERREHQGRLLSDHAPVEVTIE